MSLSLWPVKLKGVKIFPYYSRLPMQLKEMVVLQQSNTHPINPLLGMSLWC